VLNKKPLKKSEPEKKDIGMFFKRPKFNPREKFIDGMIHDPESFGVLHSCIDVLIGMRSKLPNQFMSYIQIYSSLLKTLYIYEGMLQNMYHLSDDEFKHLTTSIKTIDKKTVKNVDFKSIGKKIQERKEVKGMKRTEGGLSYIVGEVDDQEHNHSYEDREKRKHDYIG